MDDGLLAAVILDGNGGARPVDWDGVAAWNASQGALWIHLDCREPDAVRWLESEAGLDPLLSEALLAEESRPRADLVGDSIVAVFRGVNFEPGAEPEDMIAIRCLIEPARLITARRTPLRSVQGLRTALERGRGPKTVGELAARLADHLVERTEQIVDDVDDQVATFEEELLGEIGPGLRERIADTRRRVITLRRHLVPQREALARLASADAEWVSDPDRLHLRESQNRLARHLEILETVRERAVVAQDQLTSHLAEELNSRMYVLSLVAAIFLPLGFLTGLLGINVGGIPGAENPGSFGIFVVGLVVLVALELWYFRRRRWL